MGLRSAVALNDGLDESRLEAARTRQTERLSAREAAALAVAEAFLIQPAEFVPDQWDRVLEHLHPDEVTALVLRLTQFSRNKIRVALSLDVDEVRITPY